MGIVLKNNVVWGPKKAISEAFFEDVLSIIKNEDDYKVLQNEIEEAILFYTWTLDYRKKNKDELLLLLKVVEDLLSMYDDIYAGRIFENIIQVYKKSILELKTILQESIINYMN